MSSQEMEMEGTKKRRIETKQVNEKIAEMMIMPQKKGIIL